MDELKEFVRDSFNNFDFMISPDDFALKFITIKKQSKHLRFISDENIIFSEILENLGKDFLNEMVYFQMILKRMNHVFQKIKDTTYLFKSDFISSDVIEKAKNLYYSYNEDVKKFDDIFGSYLSLYALAKKNQELIEYRDEKGKQIEEMYKNDNLLIHKSIVVFEKTEKIIANKIWNGTLDWNWREKNRKILDYRRNRRFEDSQNN
ncbi:hypothetical protein [Leptotrichia sp. oral taxon 215]|uniref:hypothetical protein n=1 Tax=Leptotrichia sp. oral taxon 215 TaxID=712359 RepID=UPI0018DC398C|nr:hypothetical protein [Leptotrichia sp. oral taxon 215]